MLERIFINGIDVTEYRSHPRILELRFIMTYDMWEKEFGERADGILIGLSNAFHCDITKLRVVANQAPAIRKIGKMNRGKLVQETVFMGEVWREKRYTVGSKYLKMSKRSLYGKEEYIPKHYVDTAWLAELDQEVVTCGLKQYAVEIERFLESLEALRRVI